MNRQLAKRRLQTDGAKPRKGHTPMSINDEIGSYTSFGLTETHPEIKWSPNSGTQRHLFTGEHFDRVVGQTDFDSERSETKFQLPANYDTLPREILAFHIAAQIYPGQVEILNTSALYLATAISRLIVAEIGETEERLVGFYETNGKFSSYSQELAWLAFVFDADVTPADLEAWGVSEITIAQLIWYRKKKTESYLDWQVRAIFNGWTLPWLAAAQRELWANLLRSVDRTGPSWFTEAFAEELEQIREALSFFSDQSDGADAATAIEVATAESTLPWDTQMAWAKAFHNAGDALPDAQGRWAMLPKGTLQSGVLRYPLTTVATWLDAKGLQPADWGVKISGADLRPNGWE
jgi:hypothetical protein